jgi:hypothetical protein
LTVTESDHDEVGQELPDRDAAWDVATRYAGDSLRDLDGGLRPGADWRLEVLGERNDRIVQITIKANELATRTSG